MGPNSATWKPVDGKQASIFGADDEMASAETSSSAGGNVGVDLNSTLASLKNATITKATILQSYNTFPVPLGVTVSCLPTNEVCDTGDRYTFTTIPNTSVNTPTKLYEAGECQTQAAEWRKNYGRFSSANLETQDVLKVPNSPYVFVHETHPVINLLRMNKHLLGVDIDSTPKMDGQWFKITEPLMQTSCDTLRTKVLSRIATTDLTTMQVQLQRIGGTDWGHVSSTDAMMTFAPNPAWDPATFKTHLAAHEKNFTEKPATFMARIHLEYEIQK